MAETDLGTLSIDPGPDGGISNVDIHALVAHIDAGFRQFSKCPSATRNDMQRADVEIISSWLTFFDNRFQLFAGEPELYMPKAHPKPKPLPVPPTVNVVENSSVQHAMNMLNQMRTELCYTNDGERSNGFRPQTKVNVVDPWVEKFRAFVSQLADELSNDALTWYPDSDLQEPGVNPGEPR